VRILTFLHSFEPGGVERVALRLVRHWRKHDVDAQLVMGRADGAMADDIGHGLSFIAARRPPIETAGWETLWMILTLPRVIRAERPDILFCAGNSYAVVAVALKLLLGRSCPPILLRISNSLERPGGFWTTGLPYRLWLRLQGRYIDHFIAMETAMVAEISEGLRVPAAAISVIPDPALSGKLIERLRSGPRQRQRRPSHPGRRFVAVGRLAQQKNIALMLRAFQRGARADDTLTLIGDGPNRSRLATLARRLGIGDRVEFRGYVPEPAALLPEFDILMLSSNYEGVPAVILEALAANLPIIATECCRSMTSLLMDGALGDIVPVGDVAALANAISRARPGLQDSNLSLAQASRFTLDHASDAYLATMAKLLGRPAAQENIEPSAMASVMLQRYLDRNRSGCI
jgi:glycosyltransferase involved in cell wall biosynthesis